MYPLSTATCHCVFSSLQLDCILYYSVSEQIGSGQFGTVHKGTWNATRGPKLVAIKTLKSSATEKEEVMFLQEAAINGQFHHRNVVKLCGVVTVGHPVSDCWIAISIFSFIIQA